jgi:hypothetical protein
MTIEGSMIVRSEARAAVELSSQFSSPAWAGDPRQVKMVHDRGVVR